MGSSSPAACRTLGHLGVKLDDAKNRADAAVISADGSACVVRVVATDEERRIDLHVRQVLGLGGGAPERRFRS